MKSSARRRDAIRWRCWRTDSGWDRIQLQSTHLFAARVFDHYARCIASRSQLDPKQLNDYTVTIVAHEQRRPTYADRFKSDGTLRAARQFRSRARLRDSLHAVAFSLLDENHIAWWVEVWVTTKAIQPSRNVARTTNLRTTE